MSVTTPEADWIDISVPLRDGMATWPGDPPMRVGRAFSLAEGDPANVTTLSCCAHTGTHVDAPRHYLKDGAAVDEAPLDTWIGPARVLDISRSRGTITVDELAAHSIQAGERILLRTGNAARIDWHAPTIDRDFVGLSPEAARFLAAQKIRTLGVDYLSVSAFNDDAASVHLPLLRAGVWIIEGLDLSAIAPGPVDLICLPLRLVGADGAPARALVRPRTARR
ncbi:MAG: cyclase family protein [Deltaproteobacteria bacterium]|nr:cyclase family protein [Deltaproteobacteria bacterium]